MTSVLTPFGKMHSDAQTKARNFVLVETYNNLVNSLNDDPDGSDVAMEPSDQEVPVSFNDKIKIEQLEDDETENVPDTPTILGQYSKYLPSESILNPIFEINSYNKTCNTIGNSNNNNNNNSSSISSYNDSFCNNSNIPVYNDCAMSISNKPRTDLTTNPQNCFTFKPSSTTTTTPFTNYSQSAAASSSAKNHHRYHHHYHQQQQQQQKLPQYSSSLSSVSSSLSSSLSSSSSSLASSQSNFWSMSPSSSPPTSSLSLSASSPSLQRRLVNQNTFSSSSSPLLSSSSPMMINSSSPAPSPYSSSPSSLSSSPLLSSTSSVTARSFSDAQQKTFVSELNSSGCTVISGVPNFLSGNCYTESAGEMMTSSRNQEESLEYTDLDKLPDLSFYDDLTSMESKDQLHCKPLKSSMTSSTDESCVPLEVMVDWMRVNIERDRKELNLPHNPQCWSALDASRWVSWVCRKHNVPDISDQLDSKGGDVLCSWTSQTFVSLYGASGLNVFQELELWKTANIYNATTQGDVTSSGLPVPFLESHPLFPSPSTSPAPSHVSSSNHSFIDSQHLFNSAIENSEDEVFYPENEIKMEMSSPDKPSLVNNNAVSDLKNKFKGHPFKPRLGRGHKKAITLWQFLLELLIGEDDNSDCIKWLNKDSRIFKIEDSKKVASLWGKVKSRPAMNYDKLSRSVRQYYKKGIIKKPEQTKRLVYQFCPGIC